MSRVFCHPSLMAASILMAFPSALPARTTTPSTSPAPSPDLSGDLPASLGTSSTVSLLSEAPPSPASGAGDPKRSPLVASADRESKRKATGTAIYATAVARMATEHVPVADLNKWAYQNLPTLRTQLAQAQTLHADGKDASSRSTQNL